MPTPYDSLNQSVAQIVCALIAAKKIVPVNPNTNEEEITSAIRRIKAALLH